MDQNKSSFSKRNLSRNFHFFRYEGNLNFNYSQAGEVPG